MPSEQQTTKLAQEISQTIDSQDDAIQLETDAPASQQAEDESSDHPKEVAGYSAADLLNAPVKPPNPTTTDSPEETGSHKVALLVGGAIIVFVLGALLALVGYLVVGIILIVAAALIVVVGVFLPFR